jgi:putative transposase
MKSFKLSFSENLRKRFNYKIKKVWQYRFWDHIIRDQNDLNKHINYIHYNPVKHGYIHNPFEWSYSSINDYLKQGYYQKGWGQKEEMNFEGEFGE